MKVYFICYPHGPADRAGYEHQIISIAEGLKTHNVEFYGNVDYWKDSPVENNYLIKPAENFKEFDVVVFSSWIFYYNRLDLLPVDLFSPKRNYKLIFLDAADGLVTPGYNKLLRNVDFILKSHFCKKYSYPKNFIPWQFGLTNRILNSVKPLPFNQRQNEVLVNFRVKHQLRKMVEDNVMNYFYQEFKPNYTTDHFEESDFDGVNKLYWDQTGRRHYPSYFERLGQSKLCSAFGGKVQKSNLVINNDVFSKIIKIIENKISPFPFDRIYQFDSWRLWESLSSACCTLHLDFNKYGITLPVMPENGTHYLGIDLNNLNNVKEFLKDKDLVEYIGENGRKWVLENYSPSKIAERFLNLAE